MQLTSSEFEKNGYMPAKYTCDGDGINPPLIISDLSEKAKSLALIVDDPDAPGGDFVHWLVWNIDPEIAEIQGGSLPVGSIEGKNTTGGNGYISPCPPSGTHRYQFKLYALDSILADNSEWDKQDLLNAIEGHVLDSTTLVGLYQRK